MVGVHHLSIRCTAKKRYKEKSGPVVWLKQMYGIYSIYSEKRLGHLLQTNLLGMSEKRNCSITELSEINIPFTYSRSTEVGFIEG